MAPVVVSDRGIQSEIEGNSRGILMKKREFRKMQLEKVLDCVQKSAFVAPPSLPIIILIKARE